MLPFLAILIGLRMALDRHPFFTPLYRGDLCSLGLDSALSPFIRYITHSKASFKGLLGVHCIPNLVLYGALLLLSCTYDLNNFFSLFGIAHLDQIFIFVFIMLLVTESIKKTVKTLLGLLFYNQMLATLEIIYIITYVTTIAALYYAHIPLTVYSIFLPVFIYSAVIAGILIATLFHYYNQLPETRDGIEPGLIKRMLTAASLDTLTNSDTFLLPVTCWFHSLPFIWASLKRRLRK